jgi:nucleotide-binding universal stress UspA family protein
MYKTVLLAVALQHAERHSSHDLAARDVAVALVRGTSRRIHVLSVYHDEYVPRTLPAGMAATLRAEEHERVEKLVAHKIEEYTGPLVAEGFDVSKILRVGNAKEVIPQVAREIHADLLVMGTHRKRWVFDVARGGTAGYVSEHAPCTVVLVSPPH